MDAVHEDAIREIVIQKCAQVGLTQVLLNIAAYFIDHDPAPMLWVQTTLNEANHFAKIRFAAFLEDNPRISSKMKAGTNNTQKLFPGGMIVFRGSKSAPGLRQFPIRIVFMDDLDGFVETTTEGDPVELATARTRAFTRRLTIKCSTPVQYHRSRIVGAYEGSDQRKYLVACHACGDEQDMIWGQVKWELGEEGFADPRTARYECIACGEKWTDVHRWRAIRKGRWVATRPFTGVAGFKIGGLVSPFITLEEIVRKYLAAEGDDEALEVFMNTTLGEATRHSHEKPDEDVLYERREGYQIEMVPKGGLVLTAGVDVQKDRLEAEVVAWGRGLENWSVAHLVLWGDPTGDEVWKQLEAVLFERDWAHEETGVVCRIARVAVDAGFATNSVYAWWRSLDGQRRKMTMLTVGRDRTEYAVKPATLIDINERGRTVKGGVRLYPLGVSHLKRELYSWLAQPAKEGTKVCHFPMYGRDYFKQLTAEEYRAEKRRGRTVWRWHQTGPNEVLDCRIMARAAAIKLGIDHWRSRWLDFEIEAGHKEAGVGEPAQPGLVQQQPGLVDSHSPAPEEPKKADQMERPLPQPQTQEKTVRPTPTPPPRKKYVFRPPRAVPRRGW